MRANTARVVDLAAGLGDRTALHKSLFSDMVLIRAVEHSLLELFSRGALRGTVHTCLGQEAAAAGVVGALDKNIDAICSNHRGHGHYLAYCGDVHGLIAEIMGREDGVCGGLGGSQHLQRRNFYSNGILGGMAPVAAGIALAEKISGTGAVVVTFHGDGAMAEGVIHEALNVASLWKLPLLFAIESNRYAQSTPIELELAGAIAQRAAPYDMPVREIDGNDVLAVYDSAFGIIDEIRTGGGPQMLVLETYRLGPHSKGDDDRDRHEIERHRAKCPIVRARAALDKGWCEAVEADADARVAEIVASLTADCTGR